MSKPEAHSLRLKHVASIAVSNVDKKSVDGERSVKLCNYTDVYYNADITADLSFMEATATDTQIGQFTLHPGDVVITKDSETPDDIAVPAFVKDTLDNVVCGYHLAVIRPRSALVHPKFLYWTLVSTPLRARFGSEATGVTRFGLRADSIANTLIRVPNQANQRRLADFLDAETARIAALIAKRRRQVELVAERTWAARTALVLGLDQGASCTHPELGSIRCGWNVMRIRHVVPRVGVGVVVNPSSYFTDEGVPFIHGSDIRDGRIDLSNVKHISPDDSRMLKPSLLDPGDVIVVRAGYPGRAAVVTPELAGANCASVLILKRGEVLRPAYLAAYFNSAAARQQIQASQYGAAQEQVNVSHVIDFVVPVPSLEEQDLLLLRLAELQDRASRQTELMLRQIELLTERREALITAAVTGELDLSEAA